MEKSFIVIVGILVLAIWGITLYCRCSDSVIRRRLVAIAALFIFWLLNVLVRYKTNTYLTSTINWYLYYIPMLFVPALCATSALKAAALERKTSVRILESIALSVCGILSLLVLSNNGHNLAFVFDRPYPEFLYSYSYGPLYRICALYVVLLFIAFIVVLGYACRRRLRRAIIPLGILLTVGIAFSAMYAMRVPFVSAMNFSFFYILMVSLAIELCLDFGLLPSFFRYNDIFSSMPMDITILSRRGDAVYATARSQMGSDVKAAIRERLEGKPKELSFASPDNPDITLHIKSITGGYVLLAENMTDVNEERRRLEETNAALKRQNSMLQRDREFESELRQAERERSLLANIDTSLNEIVETIDGLLNEALNVTEAENLEKRKHLLTQVRILVAYCKRKGSLVLSQSDDEEFGAERLRVILNEAAGDLRSIGIDCAALVDTTSQVSAAAMNLLYDCYFDFIINALRCESPTIMLFLTSVADSEIELRALLECGSADAAFWLEWRKKLAEALDRRNVAYSLEAADGSAKLVIDIKAEGVA